MKRTIITALLALVAMAGQAQEARIDTIVPKFLINGYFFREMPKLPDATPNVTRLKDKEGNSVVAIGLNVDLPKSVIRQAIPREQVHNADQFLHRCHHVDTIQELLGVTNLLTWDSLTDDRLWQIDIKPDGYYAISFLVF